MSRAPHVRAANSAPGSERSVEVRWYADQAAPEVSVTVNVRRLADGTPVIAVPQTAGANGVRVAMGDALVDPRYPMFVEPTGDTPPRFGGLVIDDEHGRFAGVDRGCNFSARWDLFLIREAWHRGCDFEALADGYGPGAGTHGDWSGIRDSSPEAITRMTEAALNHLFGGGRP